MMRDFTCLAAVTCAWMGCGRTLATRIETTPAGAYVFVDGAAAGRTPTTVTFGPHSSDRIELYLPGFPPIVVDHADSEHVVRAFASREQSATPMRANRSEAWQRTRAAIAAAQNDDCASVAALAQEVRVLDSELYSAVFQREVTIGKCTGR
jgi:hypothetical protein